MKKNVILFKKNKKDNKKIFLFKEKEDFFNLIFLDSLNFFKI